jgi:hypothetical protein
MAQNIENLQLLTHNTQKNYKQRMLEIFRVRQDCLEFLGRRASKVTPAWRVCPAPRETKVIQAHKVPVAPKATG